jgi:hypothetical protein
MQWRNPHIISMNMYLSYNINIIEHDMDLDMDLVERYMKA